MLSRVTLLLLLLIFLITPAVKAGDIKKIRGEATIFSPESESPAEARKRVIKEAQIDALEKAFGTALTERTMHMSDTQDCHTSSISRSFGESLVNGEWIRTLSEPEKDITIEPVENGHMYHLKIYGEAR